MATIQLDFQHDINVSVQVGDLVYWVSTTAVGTSSSNPLNPANDPWESTTTPHDSASREDVILMGPIIQIVPWNGSITSLIVDYPNSLAQTYGQPSVTDFIMFSKDNKANLSSLSGYYAEAEMKNDDTSAVELYAVGSEIFTSSK